MSSQDPSLRRRLLAFIGGDGAEVEAASAAPTDPAAARADFNALALDLYEWQRANNPQYDAICADAPVPGSWRDISTVPVGLFRDLNLTSFPVAQARVTFRTSGTTAGRRGQHRSLDTVLYDLGAGRHARACLGPLPTAGIGLVPLRPDSSLGHMCQSFVPGLQTFFDPDQGVDCDGCWAALRQAQQAVFVPGTAFAFDLLLATRGAPTALPPTDLPRGSILMVTGGSKGRAIQLSEQALAASLRRSFPGSRVVGEYGMTELSSQLWASDWGQPYVPPPWLGVKAVDPATGRLLPPGEAGLLSFVDLANYWSVLAIETQDVGVVSRTGAVTLHGRLPGAPARGCSLTVEEALARVAARRA